MARPTLALLARERVGTLRAGRVLAFMIQWRIAEEALGHAPSIEEFMAHWAESERTAYRHQAHFRAAFPGFQTPSPLLDAVEAQWDRARGADGLGAAVLAA